MNMNAIMDPIPTRRALLAWLPPFNGIERRDRHAVGEIEEGPDGVSFRYFQDERLDAARQAGFRGYPGLPFDSEIDSLELGRIAMRALMRRLPPKNREDFDTLLGWFGLPSDPPRPYSDLSLLAYTGARLTRDGFSVCESFDGFEAPFTYIFDVAGYRRYREENMDLSNDDKVYLERERDNPKDPNAVRFVREPNQGDTRIGYINRLQAEVVGGWLDRCKIFGSVFWINGRPEYPRLFVRTEVVPRNDNRVASHPNSMEQPESKS